MIRGLLASGSARLVATGLVIGAVAVPLVAHPGRTDGSGCHTCRTNCSRWGLGSGEYHCHGGGRSRSAPPRPKKSPSSPLRAPPPPPPAPPPVVPAKPEVKMLEAPPPGHEQNWIAVEPRAGEVPAPSRSSIMVEVIAVVDGDTFVARQSAKLYLLRMRGIDAPELGQPSGEPAREWLSRQLLGRHVPVVPSKGEGCLVPVEIRLVGGGSLAEAQLRVGLAWAEPAAADSLRRLEMRARALGVGLWQGRAPEPPWEFRSRTMKSPG